MQWCSAVRHAFSCTVFIYEGTVCSMTLMQKVQTTPRSVASDCFHQCSLPQVHITYHQYLAPRSVLMEFHDEV